MPNDGRAAEHVAWLMKNECLYNTTVLFVCFQFTDHLMYKVYLYLISPTYWLIVYSISRWT
jgi:hypothetical protein